MPYDIPSQYNVQAASQHASDYRPASLQDQLVRIVADNEAQGIKTDVSLYDLDNGRLLYSHNDSVPQFAASLNKLPITLLLLEDLRSGKAAMSDAVTWQKDDVRPGLGAYDKADAPTSATVEQLLADLLHYSGNTAVRALVNYKLGGPQAVNDRLAQIPELENTRLTVLSPTTFYLGNTTSRESVETLRLLMGAGDEYQAFVSEQLANNVYSYYGVRSQLEGNDFIILANKVGFLDDADGNNRHDSGIIYNTHSGESFAYSFMTTAPNGNADATAQAEHSLDLLGRQTLRFAGDEPGPAPRSSSNGRAASPEYRVRY